jgi:hypothetical protein
MILLTRLMLWHVSNVRLLHWQLKEQGILIKRATYIFMFTIYLVILMQK